MTKDAPLADRSAVALSAWERPAMVRLDAADAEGGGQMQRDDQFRFMSMMNS